jgi:nucleoside-diphosphate-sugar epimerase
MRRVLVTGSAGFIGRWVCETLAERGIEPVRFDHPFTVLDRGGLHNAMGAVDGVINLAGVLGTPESFDVEHRAVEVNILGAVNVYEFAGISRIPVVQIGTGHKGQPNPYAITKGAAEDLALARALATGRRISVVRAFHVYGEGQTPPPPHGAAKVRKIMPSFICRALAGMKLEINGDGSQLIDLVYVADVARVLVDALTADPGSLLQAGTGKSSTVAQVARDVIAACESTSTIAHAPPRPGEPGGAVVVADAPLCDNPWPYRLSETIEWYRALIK